MAALASVTDLFLYDIKFVTPTPTALYGRAQPRDLGQPATPGAARPRDTCARAVHCRRNDSPQQIGRWRAWWRAWARRGLCFCRTTGPPGPSMMAGSRLRAAAGCDPDRRKMNELADICRRYGLDVQIGG